MIETIAALDKSILEALYAVRDPSLVQALIWVTELGSKTVILGFTVLIALVFLLRTRISDFLGLIVAVGGSSLAVFILKNTLERARPDQVFQAYLETGFALPSGHATLAMAFYGFLTYLVWRSAQTKVQKYAALASCTLIVAGIGFSRLYLGVHWASDVLAGFLIAGFFVWIGIKIVKRLARPSVQ